MRLRGGLGNQLFQYAFARGLSARTGVEVKLDAVTSFQRDFYERSYSLRHFNIRLPLASDLEIRRLLPDGVVRTVWHRLRRTVVGEKRARFDPSWWSLSRDRDRYLVGFWQTEKYFADIREQIRGELTVKYPLEGRDLDLAREIESTTSVAVHVRQLHGVSVSGRRHEFGTRRYPGCSTEYYQRAVERLTVALGRDLVLFVFADDVKGAQERLAGIGGSRRFVTHNGFDQDFQDLRLMALCRHQVIANSTFSWWGAWLNANVEKIVIAPGTWVRDATDTSDLLPESWIRLPSC